MLKIIIVQLHVIHRERATGAYKQQRKNLKRECVNMNGKGSAFDNVIVNAYAGLMLGSLLIDGYRIIGKSQWHNARTHTALVQPTVHLVNLAFAVFCTKMIATLFSFAVCVCVCNCVPYPIHTHIHLQYMQILLHSHVFVVIENVLYFIRVIFL